MSGIFDYVNRPNMGEAEESLSPFFVSGVVAMNVTGEATNEQSLSAANDELGASGPMDAAAQQDFLEIIAWNQVGTGTDKRSKFSTVQIFFLTFEFGIGNESQIRAMFAAQGLVFSS
jgi:hypothetical protein